MKKRSVSTIVCIILAMVLMTCGLSACGKAGSTSVNYSSSDLNIYKPGNWNWIDNVNAQFKEANPGIGVNTIAFNDYTAYQEKLISELYAKKGPDVIIGRSGDVRDLLKNGVLSDMSGIMPDGFGMDEFGGDIQDIGVVDNKRYYFAVDYVTPVFSTSKSLMDEAKVPDSALSSWESLAQLAREYKDKGKYLIGGNKNSIDSFFLYMLDSSGVEYIDYINHASKLENNEEKIVKIMELYKNDILPAICPEEELKKYKNETEAMKAGLFLLDFSDKENYKKLWTDNSAVKSYMDSGMVIIPLPSDGAPGKRYINTIAAINTNSKHKKEAFEYIKILMAGDVESEYTLLPASKKLKDGQLQEYSTSEKAAKSGIAVATESGTYVIKSVLLPKELASKLDDISAKSQNMVHDFGIQDVINGKMADFLKNKKSAKDTAKVIDSTINRYLKE